jgi:hypothetical protein
LEGENKAGARRASELNGWVTFQCDASMEEEAKELRVERDKRFGNRFPVKKGDERWVGDLGEFVLHRKLLSLGVRHTWHIENPTENPDFTIALIGKTAVKTVKRQDAPKPHYTQGIAIEHVHKIPIDYVFFATYEIPIKLMWILGAMEKEEFIKVSKVVRDGELVHENYTHRGDTIYNAVISYFTPFLEWLRPALELAEALELAAETEEAEEEPYFRI